MWKLSHRYQPFLQTPPILADRVELMDSLGGQEVSTTVSAGDDGNALDEQHVIALTIAFVAETRPSFIAAHRAFHDIAHMDYADSNWKWLICSADVRVLRLSISMPTTFPSES